MPLAASAQPGQTAGELDVRALPHGQRHEIIFARLEKLQPGHSLVGFLVLTIIGERLELSRLAGRSRGAGVLFVGAARLFVADLIVSLLAEAAGVRIAGAGLCCPAAWLARFDIARRTVRGRVITRYMAIALLTGYAWLAGGGVLWLDDFVRDF